MSEDTIVPVEDPLVLEDRSLDRDTFMMEGIDDGAGPLFSVGEVAKFFFKMTAHWLRWRENQNEGFWLTLPGETEPVRVGDSRTESRARFYRLSDIEKIIHAMMQAKQIDSSQFRRALHAVDAESKVWNFR